ncbi:hypothetical protein [Burkholderia sp. BCC1999]|uniref:hypothetical protein n=1 Tax=Burkholderia sp. BCC1999 TaxID=2817448 RepID=UPI002AC33557|nr:hypothetical protein [Burkholderia sp. BCC1999]
MVFKGVEAFECIDYDVMENRFGEVSKSNFDQLIGDRGAGEKGIYLIWFYDECFKIGADGYAMAGFEE